LIDGKGTGAWNQLSVLLPIFINSAIQKRGVYHFAENTVSLLHLKLSTLTLLTIFQGKSAVHISDQVALYARIVERILADDVPESGERGYYFALAHDLNWHETAAKFAVAMKARGLVDDEETRVWANDEDAAEASGIPSAFVQLFFNAE
jgi:hypothetical protein